MAQMVKAVRMILGTDSFGTSSKQPLGCSFDIEIEDDAPKRKPSLEEIDALEVKFPLLLHHQPKKKKENKRIVKRSSSFSVLCISKFFQISSDYLSWLQISQL